MERKSFIDKRDRAAIGSRPDYNAKDYFCPSKKTPYKSSSTSSDGSRQRRIKTKIWRNYYKIRFKKRWRTLIPRKELATLVDKPKNQYLSAMQVGKDLDR